MVKLSVEPDLMRAVRFKLAVTCAALRSHALHLRTRKRVAPTSTSPVPRTLPNDTDPDNGFGNQRSMGPQSDPVRGWADLP